MRLNLRDLKTFGLYFLAGVVGLSTAVYVSSIFLKRTLAQDPPPLPTQNQMPPDQGLPPLPDVPQAMPPANPQQPEMPPPSAQNPALPPAIPPSVPPAEAPPADTKPTSNTQPEGGLRTLLEGIIEDFNYEVSGRRDPFLPYTSPKAISVEEEEEIVSPLQRFELDQLKLIGIIWDTKKPKAMFLDPSQKTYIIGKLDKIGRNRGYIAEIREGEVIILERYVGEGRSTFQTRSIRLERE
jgi:Tfp pilus assembly protein PilP